MYIHSIYSVHCEMLKHHHNYHNDFLAFFVLIIICAAYLSTLAIQKLQAKSLQRLILALGIETESCFMKNLEKIKW